MKAQKSRRISRRQFHRGLFAAGAAVVTGPAFLRGRNLNEKLNIAIVGTGGRGAADTAGVASENIVALCDVSAPMLDAASAKFPAAKKYTDYRQLFDRAADFDAVVVAIPEHTHAAATMLALRNGKHVYCEKPLTHDIWEARQIREMAAKTPVATQMGIQIHATENYHQVVERVRSGLIGPVREVHVWVSRAWGLQTEEAAKRNKDVVYVTDRPKEEMTPPPTLDWDLWLGPAAWRPYNDIYLPGHKAYRWWDFGNGTMSDLGSHWNDLPFWALQLQSPLTVEAREVNGMPAHPEIAPASMSATYEYAARGEQPAVKLTWHQGDSKPEIWQKNGIPQWKDGCLFIGDKGMILSDYSKHLLLPEKDFAGAPRLAPTLPRTPAGHHADWIAACKTGKPAAADFQYSGWLTEANHLGNVAFRVGKKLQWDPQSLRATNAPEADAFIRRDRRKGWEL